VGEGIRKAAVFVLSVGVVLASLILPTVLHAAASYVQGEILVRFKPGTSDEAIQTLHAKLGAKKKIELPRIGVHRVQIAPGLSVEEAVSLYRKDPNVLYAEPNYIRRAFVIPNDSFFGQQWNLHNTGQTVTTLPPFNGTSDADIDAPEAWDMTVGSDQIIMATIDSGVDYNHPDLSANIWANPDDPPGGGDGDGNGYLDDIRGWDFVGAQSCTLNGENECECPQDQPGGPDDIGDDDPMDDFGHGTHIAGILAAEGNNNQGIAGVMWQAQIMPLKIIDGVGCGSIVDEIQAIDYAISKGARIINASFGGEGFSQSERDAIAQAGAAGILFVAAAGNLGQNNDFIPLFPANYDLNNVLSVAAVDAMDQLAGFSNYGQETVDLGAPGDCILSTTPQGAFSLQGQMVCRNTPVTSQYAYLSGTSMAAPHVSGAAGLLLAQEDSLTPAEIKTILILTTDPLDSLQGRVSSGGRLNARKALLREADSGPGLGLAGGDGGCGGFGWVDGGAVPPGTAAGFVAVLFLPLILVLIRRRMGKLGIADCGLRMGKSEIRNSKSEIARIGLVLILPGILLGGISSASAQESDASGPFERPHSIAVKLGYHLYPQSDYFDTNAAYFAPEDFSGMSGELEYDYRWDDRGSLSMTLGNYDGRAEASGICCMEFEFSTTYFLITPKYRISAFPLDGYVGAGIGYYLFEREHTSDPDIPDIGDGLSTSLSGFHILVGVQYAWAASFSTFAEVRYAWASVSSANSLDDSLGIGGTNVAVGIAYHFPGKR
jgi:subtilisin family serine protease/opacity protein-like surface antigen